MILSAPEEIQTKLRARGRTSSEVVESVSGLALGREVSEALGFPSRSLSIIGVTGTNGKTSCTHIMSYALAARGRRVLQIGTLGVQIWEADAGGASARVVFSAETGFTTPEAPSLHDLFRQAVDAGVTHVVMEVSSHALEIGRVGGVEFDVGVFTNLSQDHLDFHGSMENYGAAKRRLFERELAESTKARRIAVVAVPDEMSDRLFASQLSPVPGLLRRDLRRGRDFEVRTSNLQGLEVEFSGAGVFRSRLIGEHNAWNLSLSFAALNLLEGVSLQDFDNKLERYPGIPGRFERIGARCFVDYAHTPDALEKTLGTLRAAIQGQEKLVVVFGCGGDRDRGKRALMGRIAGRLADVVWITDDNPRTEDAASIREQIVAGVEPRDRFKIRMHGDRAEAIARAMDEAAASDVIAVCGKGHEDYQIIGTKKFPFSDQECIRLKLAMSSGLKR